MSPIANELVIWFIRWVYVYRIYRHTDAFIHIFMRKTHQEIHRPWWYLKSSFQGLAHQPQEGKAYLRGPSWMISCNSMTSFMVVSLYNFIRTAFRTWNSYNWMTWDKVKLSSHMNHCQSGKGWQILNTHYSIPTSYSILMVPLNSEVASESSRCKAKHSATSLLSLAGSGKYNREKIGFAGATGENFVENGTWIELERIWSGIEKGKQSRQGSTVGGGRDDHSLCALGRKLCGRARGERPDSKMFVLLGWRGSITR